MEVFTATRFSHLLCYPGLVALILLDRRRCTFILLLLVHVRDIVLIGIIDQIRLILVDRLNRRVGGRLSGRDAGRIGLDQADDQGAW